MKAITIIKREKRERRHKRIRSTISGTALVPRMSVYRSNNYMYVQLIDDVAGVTLASASDLGLKGTKIERSKAVGTKIAADAKAKKISKVVFDRGGFKYTGRIQTLADAAREGGLTF